MAFRLSHFSARGLGRRRLLLASVGLLVACDHVAQKNLVAGQHTEQDVRQIMGVPSLVWDLPGGARQLDYVRAPAGFDTFRVEIAADGRYQGMKQLLTEDNFRQARPGMTGEQLTRLFSKPWEVRRYALMKETLWTWRFMGSGGVKSNFNAHFREDGGPAFKFSITDDKEMYPGG